MASSKFGRKLNPYRCLREPLGVKAVRQSVVITNNPSTINQNQQLLVRFPYLGAHDVIVPGTALLAFKIALNSEHANRTVVQNLGRAIVKKISGNEVMSVDDSDVFNCYGNLWKTALERKNDQYQGIDTSGNRNATRIRIDAGNKDETVAADKAIADAFGNRFYIPLDFELLEGHMPFYQSALGDRLEYELTFNNYNRVIRATGDADSSYDIENISLEYEIVTQPELARMIANQYNGRLAILYDRVLRHRKITRDKSDTLWNINLNVPARSMKGVLMHFEDAAAQQPFARNTESFYNPKITKVEVTIEGIPNQLFSQGCVPIRCGTRRGSYLHPAGNATPRWQWWRKTLASPMSPGEFLTSKFALWLDLRTTDDDRLHGSGRRIENASEGVTIQLTKTAEAAGALNIYLYIIMDAQLNLEDGQLVLSVY